MPRVNIRYLLFGLPSLALALSMACGGGGIDIDVTSEPSGRIAFSTERDGNREVYVSDVAGDTLTNLTMDLSDDSAPSWNPAGDQIAFVSNRENGVFDMYIIDIGGNDVRKLTDDPAVEGVLRWSPDGERIAFSSARDQRKGILWVVGAGGGDPSPVLEAITPSGPDQFCAGGVPGSWLRDGETILYRGSQGGIAASQICTVGADGSDVTIILSEEGVSNDQPDLSPDGKSIVFVSNLPGQSDIYVMTAKGTDVARLTLDPGNDSGPVWSPDGQWIAFASDRDGDFDLYLMRPDGSDLRQLTNEPGAEFAPSWAP